jgi:valyl-tRNA synthetase
VAEQYGTDAVRMALISGNAPGTDPIVSEDKIKGYRNFTTKIWNMAKFILEHAEKGETQAEMDGEVLKELDAVKKEVTGYLDGYKLHLAAESVYHYVWHTVADKVIEANKAKKVSGKALEKIFVECLKMLHPFMPFVTEEIWGKIGNKNLLMVERW